jgi:6,7-dimethyl-8-ribityllumazine synthase
MGDKKKDLSSYQSEEVPQGKEMKIGIVVSEWNPEITQSLENACVAALLKHGVSQKNMKVIHVPGTYELPAGAHLLFQNGQFDGVVCLGCVIKGDTRHDEYINSAVAHGLTHLSLAVNKPVIFGVLTTENEEQAKDRAGGSHGNKGTEAAITVLKMIHLYKNFDGGKKTIGF